MVEYFVDSAKADDSGDGLSMANAKKHISAALGLITEPVSDDIVIRLAGTVASPKTYEETDHYRVARAPGSQSCPDTGICWYHDQVQHAG